MSMMESAHSNPEAQSRKPIEDALALIIEDAKQSAAAWGVLNLVDVRRKLDDEANALVERDSKRFSGLTGWFGRRKTDNDKQTVDDCSIGELKDEVRAAMERVRSLEDSYATLSRSVKDPSLPDPAATLLRLSKGLEVSRDAIYSLRNKLSEHTAASETQRAETSGVLEAFVEAVRSRRLQQFGEEEEEGDGERLPPRCRVHSERYFPTHYDLAIALGVVDAGWTCGYEFQGVKVKLI